MSGLDAIENDATRRALRRVCAWFGVGLVLAPVLDLADDAGLLTGPATLDAPGWTSALAKIGLFAAIGIAAAILLARHRAGDKTWFFIACVAVLLAWMLHTGLRASGALALVVLALAFVQLRILHVAIVETERRSRP